MGGDEGEGGRGSGDVWGIWKLNVKFKMTENLSFSAYIPQVIIPATTTENERLRLGKR